MTPSLPCATQIGSQQVVETLRRLAAEVGGLKAFEPGVREAIGNTNWTVLMQRLDEAEAALSRTAQAPVADGVREALDDARDFIIGLGQAPEAEGWPRDAYAVLAKIEAALTSSPAQVDAKDAPAAEVGELNALRQYALDATKAITGLIAGGSEYFGKQIGDIYTADLPLCVERIRTKIEAAHKARIEALRQPKPQAVAMPDGWRCFHCNEVFHDEHSARQHFGATEDREPACQIKLGAERSMLAALRRAEADAADAWFKLQNESGEAAQAYYAQASRHQEQLRAAEELGYERGLRDASPLPSSSGTGWRPMDSAPKDGTKILYRNWFKSIGFCHWDEGYDDDDQPCWWDNEADDEVCPVVWLPADALPAFPSAPVSHGGGRGE